MNKPRVRGGSHVCKEMQSIEANISLNPHNANESPLNDMVIFVPLQGRSNEARLDVSPHMFMFFFSYMKTLII